MLFVSKKNKLIRLFVPDKPRQGSLIFASKTEALPGGAIDKLWAFPQIIDLADKAFNGKTL